MRKWLTAALALILFFGLLPITRTVEAAESLIEDPVLEAAIRKQLGLPDGELTVEHLQQLESLYHPEGGDKISSLKGLEHAIYLDTLILPGQNISDISPLEDLYWMEFLSLPNNQIEDVSPLKYMYDLKQLHIYGNQITNIDSLFELYYLTNLLAADNQISNITALANMPLVWADLDNNQVASLAPLKWHPTLQALYISGNRLHDIDELLTIDRLQQLMISGNPLADGSNQILNALDASGVYINDAAPVSKKLTVDIDGSRLYFNQPPVIQDGTTLVQFRPLFETLGLKVDWIGETQTVTGETQGLDLALQIGNPEAHVNGNPVELRQAPQLIDGHTYVPARFVAETMGYKVRYHPEAHHVSILTKPEQLYSVDYVAFIDLGDDWYLEDSGLEDGIGYAVSASEKEALFLLTVEPWEAGEVGNLHQYANSYYRELESLGYEITAKPAAIKVNSYDAVTLSYKMYQTGQLMAVTSTVFQGDEYFYIVVLAEEDSQSSDVLSSYERVLHSFRQKPSYRNKFGSLYGEERVQDIVSYYKDEGFFSASSGSVEEISKLVLSWLEEEQELVPGEESYYNELVDMPEPGEEDEEGWEQWYNGQIDYYWDPFNPNSEIAFMLDVYVLAYDEERVWFKDIYPDAEPGSNTYRDLLRQWSAISRGAFNPLNIREEWRGEEGPIVISFLLNGERQYLYPGSYYYLDVAILRSINKMIEDTGYQFVVYELFGEAFITVLTDEEKAKIEEERMFFFDDLNAYSLY